MGQKRFRIIQSGSCYEAYYYRTGIPERSDSPKLDSLTWETKTKESIAFDSYNRSRNNLRRLVDCNFSKNHSFITLTIDARKLQRPASAKQLGDMYKRLQSFNRSVRKSKSLFTKRNGSDLRYLCVPERQPISGNWHFHCIWDTSFSSKHLTQLRTLWRKAGGGNIDIQRIKHVTYLGAYISKYLTKSSYHDIPPKMRHYNCSRNILRPIDRYVSTWEEFVKSLPTSKFYQKEFDTIIGSIVYRLYNL